MQIFRLIIWGLTCLLGGYIIYVCGIDRPDYRVSDPTIILGRISEPLIKANLEIFATEPPLSEVSAQRVRKNIEMILKKAPLNDDALLQSALIEHFQSKPFSRPELLTSAQNRNSRNRSTLRALTRHYASTRDLTSLLKQVDILYRLDRKNQAVFSEILDGIYQTQDGWEAVYSYMSGPPVWGNAFLARELVRSENNIAAMNRLRPIILAYVNAEQSDGTLFLMIRGYLLRLVKLGLYQEAYEFWLQHAGGAPPSQDNLIFNPKFQTLQVAPPFNWNPVYGRNGGLELDSSGAGAYAFFNHSSPMVLTQQFVKIPTVETLEFMISGLGKFSKRQGRFEWRFICQPEGRLVHILEIEPAHLTGQEFRQSFSGLSEANADGCPFINVQLLAFPGKYARRISMVLTKVELRSKVTGQ